MRNDSRPIGTRSPASPVGGGYEPMSGHHEEHRQPAGRDAAGHSREPQDLPAENGPAPAPRDTATPARTPRP